MCGRFTLRTDPREIAQQLELPFECIPPGLEPRYNIAPTQPILVLRRPLPTMGTNNAPATESIPADHLELVATRWGMVPGRRSLREGPLVINARSETVLTKPMFREAIQGQRCLIPADGFYEWKAVGRRKDPYYLHFPGEPLFTFAALWDLASPVDQGSDADLISLAGPELRDASTILTTAAEGPSQTLHDRMPLIVPRSLRADWLDPAVDVAALIEELRRHGREELLTMRPVSNSVNRVARDGPSLLDPPPPREETGWLFD